MQSVLSKLQHNFERIRVRTDELANGLIRTLAATPDLGVTFQTGVPVVATLGHSDGRKVFKDPRGRRHIPADEAIAEATLQLVRHAMEKRFVVVLLEFVHEAEGVLVLRAFAAIQLQEVCSLLLQPLGREHPYRHGADFGTKLPHAGDDVVAFLYAISDISHLLLQWN